jgi:hypothetical protein
MEYIEAPTIYEPGPRPRPRAVFLAGGITGCPDWQQRMVSLLSKSDMILLNPRRENFPIHDPDAAVEQITWEHNHLRRADAILFWFPWQSTCPIVLYELGAWSKGNKQIFVAMDPQYERRRDVEIQTVLVRPDMRGRFEYSVQGLAYQVLRWDEQMALMGHK